LRANTIFKSTPIVGYILILLNVSQQLTVIPALFFGNVEWYFHQSIIVTLNILFLFTHKLNTDPFKQVKKSVAYYSVLVLCLIFVLELPRFLVNSDGRNVMLTVLNAIEFITFYNVLSSVYYELVSKRGYKLAHQELLKVYVIFASGIVLTSVFVFILASLKIVDPSAYAMPPNFSINVDSDAATLGTQYYFPLHLTIIISDNRGLPFFSNYGVFCGLSHEPHIATYIVTPAVFFLQALNWSKRTKLILTIFFIIFLLTATSTTNLIALMVVFFALILINIKNGNYVIFNIFCLVVIVGIFSFFSLSDLGFAAAKAKLDTSSGTSLDYSRNFLSHVVSPREFWGDGAFNVPFPYARVKDIGIVSSVLIIGLYILLLASAIRLIVSSTRTLKFIGAGCLYFLLHSLKIVQLALIYPYTLMIMFFMLVGFQAMKLKIYNPA